MPCPYLWSSPEPRILLTWGNSRANRAVPVLAGQEDSASASQPISSRNTSTPPTFWPGTEPYVCSLWDPIFFQRSPAFTLHKPEARPPWVTQVHVLLDHVHLGTFTAAMDELRGCAEPALSLAAANKHPKVLSVVKLFPGCDTKPGGGQPGAASRWAASLTPRRRSRPTWGLAPGGLWCSHRSQLSWILSARGDTGLGEGQQGQEFGTEKTQRVHASLTALSISKPSCTHPPALHGRSSECPQISQPGDPRNLPPFRLEQLARAQCFP
nr:uncharacterized protein LOC106045520 [Anser cygnoides]